MKTAVSVPSLRRNAERGGTTVAIAGSIVAMVAVSALVIDVGQVLVTQAELQSVADLASKSAAQELARIYMTAGRGDPLDDTLSGVEMARIQAAADARARKNSAGSVPISIRSADVQIGKWNDAGASLAVGALGVDGVQVKARRDVVSNGLVQLLLPSVLGKATVAVTSTSAARLSGVRYVPAGVADFPVGIAKAWYTSHASPCATNNRITLYPTGTAEGCAGWHTFQTEPASASALKTILDGLRTGTWTSPEIDVQKSSFMFSGGTISSAFNELVNLYEAKKNAAGEMRTLIPVYDRDDCGNPQGWIRIVGVARAVVTNVVSGSDKRVEARVECDVIKNAESGGSDYGVLAAGPDLVR